MIKKNNRIDSETENSTNSSKDLKTNKLVDPYVTLKLNNNLDIEPKYFNEYLYDNLKLLLSTKLKNKCIEHGYVMDIQQITNYSNGYINPNRFDGAATYSIKYNATVCVPIVGTIIVASIHKRYDNADFMLAISGPMYIIIKKRLSDINNAKFSLDNNGSIYYKINDIVQKNMKLDIGYKIKILVKEKKFYNTDDNIKIMGYLQDIASNEEIEKYYKPYETKLDEIKDSRNNIEFNEDNDINEVNINNIDVNNI